MSDHERIRRSFESALDGIQEDLIVGRDEIAVTWPISTNQAGDGQVTHFHLFLQEFCSNAELLDVAGYGRTGQTGEVELSLNEFHCRDVPAAAGRNTLGYRHPVNVIATPRSSSPVLLSATARIGPGDNRPEDVFITISAWDLGGDPAPNIRFYWRCRVPIVEVIG